MSDPLAHLTAALDAAQRDAEAAAWCAEAQAWSVFHGTKHYEHPWVVMDGLDDGVAVVQAESSDSEGVAAHMARHDPASALRRIAADRKTLAEYEKARAEYEADGPAWDHESETGRTRTAALELAVRNLAEGWGWTGEATA
jgi:hypothetical protein